MTEKLATAAKEKEAAQKNLGYMQKNSENSSKPITSAVSAASAATRISLSVINVAANAKAPTSSKRKTKDKQGKEKKKGKENHPKAGNNANNLKPAATAKEPAVSFLSSVRMCQI